MDIKSCNGCKMLVVMYKDDPRPFRWCNAYRQHVNTVDKCEDAYKNKDPQDMNDRDTIQR